MAEKHLQGYLAIYKKILLIARLSPCIQLCMKETPMGSA